MNYSTTIFKLSLAFLCGTIFFAFLAPLRDTILSCSTPKYISRKDAKTQSMNKQQELLLFALLAPLRDSYFA